MACRSWSSANGEAWNETAYANPEFDKKLAEAMTQPDVEKRKLLMIQIANRATDTISSIQMVFQNPFDTLNPSHSVGSQIIRTLAKFKVGKSHAEREKRMYELLDLVKLPRAFAQRMPRQLSGGQKQRIGVARALPAHPRWWWRTSRCRRSMCRCRRRWPNC